MRRLRTPLLFAIAGLCLASVSAMGLSAVSAAEPMSYDGSLDIGAMMKEAGHTWNLDAQDAVLLLESRRVSWLPDGRLRDERHRVVWVSSHHALGPFADLRVPWDSGRQKLTVNVLRVWRDHRWIQARPTAVVETTPFQFQFAPDYTGIRETMLLHDGIELPCILECDYVIEDTKPFRAGMDGECVLRHEVPTLMSRLILETPTGVSLQVHASDEVTATTDSTKAGSEPGLVARTYAMHAVAAAPRPATADPASYLPHVQWSMFASWDDLGRAIRDSFTPALVLNDALRDSLSTLTVGADGAFDTAHRIADFVHRSQRTISYDPAFFLARVRPAARTYETGYGVALDQAALAAVLFRQAGFQAAPAYRSRGTGNTNEGVATVSRFEPPGLWVSGKGIEAYFDATTDKLYRGLAAILGRTVWVPGRGDPAPVSGTDESRMVASLDLRWDAEKTQWSGTGYVEAGGAFGPYDAMAGGDGDARETLQSAAAGVLDGANVDAFNPVDFNPALVSAHLELHAPAAKRDAFDRLPVVIGSPKDGLVETLPADMHLYLAERGTPVQLPSAVAQKVTITLHLGGLDIIRLPEPNRVENDAGRFELAVQRDADTVTVTRTTELAKARYAPEEWPAVREILLAETDAANRTVLLR